MRGHTALVLAAAERLLSARANASLEAVRLEISTDAERLRRIVQLAAFVHDLGKANDHFQEMIRGKRRAPQMVRHEALSFWLCWPGQPLAVWLRDAVADDQEYRLAILSGVAHHRKFWRQAIAPESSGAGVATTLLVTHEDFRAVLALGADKLGLGTAPVFDADIEIRDERRASPQVQFERWETEVGDWPPVGSRDARLLAVSKALVICADVAGSALPKSRETLGWIDAQLARRTQDEALLGLVDRRLEGRPLRDFQHRVAGSPAPVTLVRAGCGSGKTVAAYLWAARQHPARQLWVTYPTTGTATEGFRDYVFGADVTGRLEHSRAVVDVELFCLRDDEEGQRDLDRLNSIRAWGCDVVTCTVDTVLGLVQNQRKGLYAWPGLCHGTVVFDEVHAYDGTLFGALLRFLEALPGVPVLLMTASLPGPRLKALRALTFRVHGRALEEIEGPADIETLPRYLVRVEPELETVWAEVTDCLHSGGRVLWVCNTVDGCLNVARSAGERDLKADPLIYHSRFRYVDRIARHGAVIDAFRAARPTFATTTQVAEMSLDLSADLLVTDQAPIAALIQRMGRLNRRSTPARQEPVRPCLVLPFGGAPYVEADLRQTDPWLAALHNRPISQKDLVDAWEALADHAEPEVPTRSEWLDGRFLTEPAAVRDASPGVTVLLESDVAAVRNGKHRLTEVALPMNPPPPCWRNWWEWRTENGVPIAPVEAIDYDPIRGARWRRT